MPPLTCAEAASELQDAELKEMVARTQFAITGGVVGLREVDAAPGMNRCLRCAAPLEECRAVLTLALSRVGARGRTAALAPT